MSSDAPVPAPRDDGEPLQPPDDNITSRRPDPIPDPDSDHIPDRKEGIAAPTATGGVPRVRELRERWDDEEPGEKNEDGPPVEPEAPHPGFWWACLWCLFVLMVTQLIVPTIVIIVWLVFTMVRLSVDLGNVKDGLEATVKYLNDIQTDPAFNLSLLSIAHGSMIVMSLLVLRIAVGREWRREVALKVPGAYHLLLVVLGVPALWLTSNGVALLATLYLPGLNEIIAYSAVVPVLMILVCVVWLLIRLATGKDYVAAVARAPLGLQLALGPAVVLALFGAGVLVFHLVRPWMPTIPVEFTNDMMQKMVEMFQKAPWWAAILVVGGCPMFSEELWCRAFLGRGLVGRQGLVFGVIWTSFFFGAIHLIPQQAIMAMLYGVILHYMYLTSKSLVVPMIAHCLNNSLAVAGGHLPGLLGDRLRFVETSPERIPLAWFGVAIVLAAAVIWAFYSSRARLLRVDGSGLPPWQPPFAGVAHPPAGTGTAVVRPLPRLAAVAIVFIAVALLILVMVFVDPLPG